MGSFAPNSVFVRTFALCAKMLVKLTPGVNFKNMLTQNFYTTRSQKGKKTVKSSGLVYSFEYRYFDREKIRFEILSSTRF
jgi:hypothetical protein